MIEGNSAPVGAHSFNLRQETFWPATRRSLGIASPLQDTLSISPGPLWRFDNPGGTDLYRRAVSPAVTVTIPGPIGDKRLRMTAEVQTAVDTKPTFIEVVLPRNEPKQVVVFRDTIGERFVDRDHREVWEKTLLEEDTLVLARLDSARLTPHLDLTPSTEGGPNTVAEAVTVYLAEQYPTITQEQIVWTKWSEQKPILDLNGMTVSGGEKIRTPWTGDKELHYYSFEDPRKKDSPSHILLLTNKPLHELDDPIKRVGIESLCACMTHGREQHDCIESLPLRMQNIFGGETGDQLFFIDPYGTTVGLGNVIGDAEAFQVLIEQIKNPGKKTTNLDVRKQIYGDIDLRQYQLVEEILRLFYNKGDQAYLDSRNTIKKAAVMEAGFDVHEIPSGVGDDRLAELYGDPRLKNPTTRYIN
jgi:hypothetical protein